jgi:hypothetical protein
MANAKNFRGRHVRHVPDHLDAVGHGRGHRLLTQDMIALLGKISHGICVQVILFLSVHDKYNRSGHSTNQYRDDHCVGNLPLRKQALPFLVLVLLRDAGHF